MPKKHQPFTLSRDSDLFAVRLITSVRKNAKIYVANYPCPKCQKKTLREHFDGMVTKEPAGLYLMRRMICDCGHEQTLAYLFVDTANLKALRLKSAKSAEASPQSAMKPGGQHRQEKR